MELMARRQPGQDAALRRRRGRPVRRPRRAEDARPPGRRAEPRARWAAASIWVVVTSQEKLTELVGGLDDQRVELARLMDRFPLQVHLEPSDISEVTSKRVLSKNAAAETALARAVRRSTAAGSPTTPASPPTSSSRSSPPSRFIDLYPLLPYQIDLIIQVVSGLRTQGGASKHVGGANRTIIKLAQQLLIHPDVDLANAPIGTLARHRPDLRPGLRQHRQRDPRQDRRHRQQDRPPARPAGRQGDLPAAVRAAASTARAENIAAALHPAVDADSRLAEVRQALRGPGEGPHGPPRRRRLPHPDARRGRLGAPAHRPQPRSPATSTASTPRSSPASGSRSPPTPCWTSSSSRRASSSAAG